MATYDLSSGTKVESEQNLDSLSKSELKKEIRGYAEGVDIQVDLADVKIELSTKMKKAAGKAIQRRGGHNDGLLIMRFAWGAYQKWGWNEDFTDVIRHELVHIWEYQQGYSGGHGVTFKRKADELDAPRHCPVFTEAKYHILCGGCGKIVARRYQRSKMVKKSDKYRSKCCNAPCESERNR